MFKIEPLVNWFLFPQPTPQMELNDEIFQGLEGLVHINGLANG